MKFVITGLPRSGTKYVSEVCKSIGINCGHEEIFTPLGISDTGALLGDASWMAVPYLEKLKRDNITIIHLKRDIKKVVKSLEELRFFDREYNPAWRLPYRNFAMSHLDFKGDIGEWCLGWLLMLKPYADLTINVEDIHGFPSIPKNLNARTQAKEDAWN